jgi:SAM-dependent methyltransferase
VSYTPGWTTDAVTMMAARRAGDRAGAILASLPDAGTVLDVGCGPGTITVGLAAARRVLGIDARTSPVVAAPGNVWFATARADALPCPDASVDVYFSHALFEHLADPAAALAEAHRVLRPGGRLAVIASDWSHARFDPRTPDVDAALRGHRLLRHRAGADPDTGARLPDLVTGAGFTIDQAQRHQRVDLGYAELATYIATRLAAAADDTLADALAAARRWQHTTGDWTQCWTEVTARKPRG